MSLSIPRQYVLIGCLTTLISVSWSSTALAQDPCADQGLPAADGPWNPAAPFQRIAQLLLTDCLGGAPDTMPVSVAVRKILDVPRVESDRFRPAAEAALEQISAHVVELHGKLDSGLLKEVIDQIALARSLLGTGQTPAVPAAWELDQGRVFVISVPLQQVVTRACTTVSADCRQQFELVREVVRITSLTRAALSVSETPVMIAHLRETSRRARMWDEYFTSARSQYLWELMLNGRLMPDSRENVGGVKRGFRNVPTSQLMLLHPTVAMEYSDAEPEGNRFAGVAIIDVIGYNRWGWKPDGTMGFAVGGSVIAAVGDHVNTNDVRWGVMLHLDHRWSVGATFGGDNTAVIVSPDVAQLWSKVSSLRKRRLMTGS